MLATTVLLIGVAAAFAAAETFCAVGCAPALDGVCVLTGAARCAAATATGETTLATAVFAPSYATKGWDVLKLRMAPPTPTATPTAKQRRTAHYGAGKLEGWATADGIWDTFVNTMQQFYYLQITPAVNKYVDEHIAYVTAAASNHSSGQGGNASADSPFWTHVADTLAFLEGMTAGYNVRVAVNGTAPTRSLAFRDLYMVNLQMELSDILDATEQPRPRNAGNTAATPNDARRRRRPGKGHCSALIRVVNGDVFFAHATWMYYNSLHKQYKVYDWWAGTVAFSGYPGMLASFDDWYMTSHGLGVTETTNELYNMSLYELLSPRSVSEFLRITAANFLATSGAAWAAMALTENSGTYNSQWMVLDTNIVNPTATDPGARLPNGSLWVMEQLPGPYSRAADVTDVLRTRGYWASYNIPYFESVYNYSGNAAMKAQYGSYFSYDNYARAQIFRREAPRVFDVAAMRRLMRYNNYETEEFALIPPETCRSMPGGRCVPDRSALLTIAARGDLDPMNCTLMGTLCASGVLGVGQQNVGAVDAKITSWRRFREGNDPVTRRRRLSAEIISGPTFDAEPIRHPRDGRGANNATAPARTLPDFVWTVPSLAGVPHVGIPSVITPRTFGWVRADSAANATELPPVGV